MRHIDTSVTSAIFMCMDASSISGRDGRWKSCGVKKFTGFICPFFFWPMGIKELRLFLLMSMTSFGGKSILASNIQWLNLTAVYFTNSKRDGHCSLVENV